MKIIIGLASLFIASVVCADVMLVGGQVQTVTANSGDNIRNSYGLEDDETSLAPTLSVGETLVLDWLVTASAYGSSVNGTNIGYNNTTGGWNTSFRFGIGDVTSANGIGVDLRLTDEQPQIAMGVDTSVTVGGNFGISNPSKVVTTALAGTDDALKFVGQTASMEFHIERTAISDYNFTFIWGTENHSTALSGVTIDTVDKVLLRHDGGTADLGVTLELVSGTVVPEPASLGLVAIAGVILLTIRRILFI